MKIYNNDVVCRGCAKADAAGEAEQQAAQARPEVRHLNCLAEVVYPNF